MTKRSPILGYNHNVRYRGLVFHVQTEDSGVLSPHLFTHLFHEGVIVSTRKLVYDAGAAEDAIKALMQAQHKAVMKDLKNGAFDDKIDINLAGTAGLEPARAKTAPVPRASTPELTPTVKQDRAVTDVDSGPVEAAPLVSRAKSDDELTTPVALEISTDDLSTPIELPRKPEPPPIELTQPAKARTKTAERGSKGSAVRFNPPPVAPPLPSDDIDPPTLTDDSAALAAAVSAANQGSQPAVSRTVTPAPGLGVTFRSATPPPIPTRAQPPPIPQRRSLDSSSAEVSLSLDDGESQRNRVARDTAVEAQPESDGVPQPRNRPPSHGAATLPPAKKPSRPAITPPNVVSRQISNADDKSGAVEIYAPAPASVEPPPGERAERPGQYSVNRQRGTDVPMREKTGRIAALTPGALPVANRPKSPSEKPSASRIPPPTPVSGSAIPQAVGKDPSPGVPGAVRTPQVTAPITNRNPNPSSGVVMTRPAVIVGAPQKPQQSQPPRVRKAREEEGRGFGQGLISEKSLDEVILAYLSEDGDDT